MELKGTKGLLFTRKLERTCNVETVPIRLAVLSGVRGHFGPKKGCFVAPNAQFWEGISKLGAPAPGRQR